jgi:hypothetical protein
MWEVVTRSKNVNIALLLLNYHATLSGLCLFHLFFVPHVVIYGRSNLRQGRYLQNLAFKSVMLELNFARMDNVELYSAYSKDKPITN